MKFRIVLLVLAGLPLIMYLADALVVTESVSETLSIESPAKNKFFEMPDSNINRDIYLNLKSAVAIDNKSGRVLYCQNAQKVYPIASISKLLTAMVVLDNYRPDTVIQISKKDARRSARSLFRTGTKVRMKDLLHAALLVSDNRAARAMARAIAGSYEKFAELMNKKTRQHGLKNTKMYEPTGLDERNRSTAEDVARLVNAAYKKYPEIARITSLKKYVFKPVNRKRSMRLVNTNKMVYSPYRVRIGKTGYIIKSDYCLTTIVSNKAGEEVTLVVLGSPRSSIRFKEARRLANYAFRKIS